MVCILRQKFQYSLEIIIEGSEMNTKEKIDIICTYEDKVIRKATLIYSFVGVLER